VLDIFLLLLYYSFPNTENYIGYPEKGGYKEKLHIFFSMSLFSYVKYIKTEFNNSSHIKCAATLLLSNNHTQATNSRIFIYLFIYLYQAILEERGRLAVLVTGPDLWL
jgi:hypothetical protein